MSNNASTAQSATLFGHPAGLFTLFFAEMWERFSYYGMRALLMLYMLKGFLKYGDSDAIAVYTAYTALVYMTPFFGGMLADKLLGARRAVILGGLLMAAGHLLMTIEDRLAFFGALALLICGNGFFKPNISTIVGSLYPQGSPRRDGGFTIFYMGINLGAAMSPLLCGYIGETYGWHWGFGLATLGMLIGVAIFVAPTVVTQALILAGALATATGLFFIRGSDVFTITANLFVAIALLVSAGIAATALGRGGVPAEAGAPPDPERLRRPIVGPISAEWMTYLGAILAVGVFLLLVSGLSVVTRDGHMVTVVPESVTKSIEASKSPLVGVLGVFLQEISRPAGLVLMISGLVASVYLLVETFRMDKVARERMFVVIVLTFFSMLFWAFFEQAGSSVMTFTDRNIDRVAESSYIAPEDVGKTIQLQPTQEQLGYFNGDKLFTMSTLDELRKQHEKDTEFTIDWKVTEGNVGMGVATRAQESPASVFQAVNPVFILLFGLVFTVLWTMLGKRGLEPSTPLKFSLGLLQLGLGFVALWYGAVASNDRGMVWLGWLFLAYLLHTTGELCLSPVGLSMVTKLSPARLVSTVMGAWFLATAFSQLLAGIIAQFTGIEGTGEAIVPAPSETVQTYGHVYGWVAVVTIICAGVCFLLVPLLKYWTHPEADNKDSQ